MNLISRPILILYILIAIIGPVYMTYDVVQLIPESALIGTMYEGNVFLLPVLMGVLGFGFVKWMRS